MKLFRRSAVPAPIHHEAAVHEWAEFNVPAELARLRPEEPPGRAGPEPRFLSPDPDARK